MPGLAGCPRDTPPVAKMVPPLCSRRSTHPDWAADLRPSGPDLGPKALVPGNSRCEVLACRPKLTYTVCQHPLTAPRLRECTVAHRLHRAVRSTKGHHVFEVITGDKRLRTHSLDRVARRLFGRNAVAVVEKEENGHIEGVFAVLDRKHGESVYIMKQPFLAAA